MWPGLTLCSQPLPLHTGFAESLGEVWPPLQAAWAHSEASVLLGFPVWGTLRSQEAPSATGGCL